MDRDPRDLRRIGSSPFGALVAAACRDAGAAQGLASAYVALDASGRRRMVEAVAHDARAEGEPPAVALAPLLGVEEDASIARAIFETMEADGGRGLGAVAGARAMLAGASDRGTAVLVRPLYGEFVELLALTWDAGGVSRSRFEPLLRPDEIGRHVGELPDAALLADRPYAEGVQRVTEALWAHLREHGRLPDGLERFADVL